jgi:hypothetical protein
MIAAMPAGTRSECLSSTCSSRGAGLKPRTCSFAIQFSINGNFEIGWAALRSQRKHGKGPLEVGADTVTGSCFSARLSHAKPLLTAPLTFLHHTRVRNIGAGNCARLFTTVTASESNAGTCERFSHRPVPRLQSAYGGEGTQAIADKHSARGCELHLSRVRNGNDADVQRIGFTLWRARCSPS